MPTLKTKLIPESETKSRTILTLKIPPILKGSGEYTYIYGACENLLADHIKPDQIIGIVLKCPKCGSFSEM